MDKIKQFRLRTKPVTNSTAAIDASGNLVDFQIRADVDENEGNIVKGYLCVWNTKDRHDTIWTKGCFAKSIRERGPDSMAKQKIIFLWQHRTDEPIGRFRVLLEDDYGLYFEAVLDDVPTAKRCYTQIKSGTINQFSFGFDYIWDKVEWDDTFDGLRVFECELFEGSAVSFASNKETYAIRSATDFETEKENLDLETEEFIKSIPRRQQLELRQLISRQIALSNVDPAALREKPTDEKKPLNPTELNISEILKIIN